METKQSLYGAKRYIHHIGALLLLAVMTLLLFYQFGLSVTLILLFVFFSAVTHSTSVTGKWDLFFRVAVVVAQGILYITLVIAQDVSVQFWWMAQGYVAFIVFSYIAVYAYIREKTLSTFSALALLIFTVVGTTSFYPAGTLIEINKEGVVVKHDKMSFYPSVTGYPKPLEMPWNGEMTTFPYDDLGTIKAIYYVFDIEDVPADEWTKLNMIVNKGARVQIRCDGSNLAIKCVHGFFTSLLPHMEVVVKHYLPPITYP